MSEGFDTGRGFSESGIVGTVSGFEVDGPVGPHCRSGRAPEAGLRRSRGGYLSTIKIHGIKRVGNAPATLACNGEDNFVDQAKAIRLAIRQRKHLNGRVRFRTGSEVDGTQVSVAGQHVQPPDPGINRGYDGSSTERVGTDEPAAFPWLLWLFRRPLQLRLPDNLSRLGIDCKDVVCSSGKNSQRA